MSPTAAEEHRPRSLWWDGLGPVPGPRPALPGDLEVDVAIVGGGLTGLDHRCQMRREKPRESTAGPVDWMPVRDLMMNA